MCGKVERMLRSDSALMSIVIKNVMPQMLKISPSQVKGRITPPTSKSHTQRAILLGTMASGTTKIHDYLTSPDSYAMLKACQYLGASICIEGNDLTIEGIGGKIGCIENVIDAGNSGIVLRFLTAMCALAHLPAVITGDDSIRHNRPMAPLLTALNQLHVQAVSTRNDGYAPVIVQGPLIGGSATLDGSDSQAVSALLLASMFAAQKTELTVLNAGEKPWIDMTLWWMHKVGASVYHRDYSYYCVEPIKNYRGFEYTIPADLSSAAFPIAAALTTGGHVELKNVDLNDCQGDKVLFDIFSYMGGDIRYLPKERTLIATGNKNLQGVEIDLNNCIDAVPIMATVACFASSPTYIRNVANAKHKESNRLTCITRELNSIGANITELDDGLLIHPAVLNGGHVHSYNDHRIAMSLIIAALAARKDTYLKDYHCIAKSYPDFLTIFKTIGASIEVIA
jgi:3-phosphoshikimate 1-carboxyvinyltransferase